MEERQSVASPCKAPRQPHLDDGHDDYGDDDDYHVDEEEEEEGGKTP